MAVDVHPGGRRLVTCGTAPQIKVWNLLPILDPAAESDPGVPKLLATLSEHQGGVLTARFSHGGALLASGGNDNAVLLYRLAPGPGTAKLGAAFVNLENWRVAAALRGHSLDVTGLAWAPGDAVLASCSMDGTVLLHSVGPDGAAAPLHAIRRDVHNGWVKGLAFDPLGRYLASQGRNGVKVWDVAKDWAPVAHVRDVFDRAPEMAFKLKISWSPDGEQLMAASAVSGGQPTVCLLKRQSWEQVQLVGHKSAVVAVVANPRLFYAPRALTAARSAQADSVRAQADGGEPGGGAAQRGGAECAGFEDTHSFVLAAGSNDKGASVWCSDLPLPLVVLQQLHAASVVDLAWTPDGYTLVAASTDDSITVVRFSEAELGRSLSEAEYRAVMEAEYGAAAAAGAAGPHGAAAGRAGAPGAGGGGGAVEDAELARLAAGAAAAARPASGGAAPPALSALPAPVPAPAPAPVPAPAAVPAPAPRRLTPQAVGGGAGGGGSAGLLEARLMPQGAGITSGTLQQPGAAAGAAAASRKRVQPAPAAGLLAKRPAAAGGQGAGQQLLRQARAGGGGGGAPGGGWLLGAPPVWSRLEAELTTVRVVQPRPQGPGGAAGGQVVPVVLAAANGAGAGGARVAEVVFEVGGDVSWRDKVQGEVVAVAGSAYFAAAATSAGLLHTWRPGGTMLLPPLALGAPPVRLSCGDGRYQLQVVSADGELLLLDFNANARLMGPTPPVSLAPLLAACPPGTGLHDAWVSGGDGGHGARAHVAVLTDGSGWLYHAGLGLWLQLQPGAAELAGSVPPTSAIALSGDAERLRASAAAAAAAGGGAPLRLPAPAPDDDVWRRKEAGTQLMRALLLADAAGYERWLGLLVNLLATQRDQSRLKELAQDLLGPERWTPALAASCAWQPRVLGLDKRAMLGALLVPAAAREGLPIARSVSARGAAPGCGRGLLLRPPRAADAAACRRRRRCQIHTALVAAQEFVAAAQAGDAPGAPPGMLRLGQPPGTADGYAPAPLPPAQQQGPVGGGPPAAAQQQAGPGAAPAQRRIQAQPAAAPAGAPQQAAPPAPPQRQPLAEHRCAAQQVLSPAPPGAGAPPAKPPSRPSSAEKACDGAALSGGDGAPPIPAPRTFLGGGRKASLDGPALWVPVAAFAHVFALFWFAKTLKLGALEGVPLLFRRKRKKHAHARRTSLDGARKASLDGPGSPPEPCAAAARPDAAPQRDQEDGQSKFERGEGPGAPGAECDGDGGSGSGSGSGSDSDSVHDEDDVPDVSPVACSTLRQHMSVAPERLTMEWQGMGCAYSSHGLVKVVLADVWGKAAPGEMQALMGPSGAGKSTFMDILAMRKSVGALSGRLLLNGRPAGRSFIRQTAYVPQEDNFVPTMTTAETLRFYARVILPATWPTARRAERLSEVLDAVGLGHAQHTLVGGTLPGGLMMRGLSGGERKRLSIAAGILAAPGVLFLDEPTSGLDSFAALSVMGHLQRMARAAEHIIVATIHQPRAAIWAMFDKVTLLAGGRLMYHGQREGMTAWFGSLGYTHDPLQQGVASDWALDLVAVGFAKPAKYYGATMRTRDDLAAAAKAFREHYLRTESFVPAPDAPAPGSFAAGGRLAGRVRSIVSKGQGLAELAPDRRSKYPTGAGRQFLSLLSREFILVTRNPFDVAARALTFTWVAILIGLLYYGMPPDASSLRARLNLCYVSLSFVVLMPYISMGLYTSDKKFYLADASAKLYRPAAYYAAKVVCALCFAWTLYGMAGMRPGGVHIVKFGAVVTLVYLISVQVLHACAIFAPNQDTAFMLSIVWTTVQMLVSTFFVNFSEVTYNHWLTQLRYVSALYFGFEALVLNEFTSVALDCSAGLDDAYLGFILTAFPGLNPSQRGVLNSLARPQPKCGARAARRGRGARARRAAAAHAPAAHAPAAHAHVRPTAASCAVNTGAIADYFAFGRPFGHSVAILLGYLAAMHGATYAAMLLSARKEAR
ncbi:abcG22 [Scenedesmus sp. PABB004]|nr:abcG22 [Scenedesmus sp. PABB004]